MELEEISKNKGDAKEEEYKLEVPKESFWEGMKRHTRAYCEITSIQGLNYIVKDGVSWMERAWWILVFILCIGGCSYMVFEIIDKWNTTPVLVSLATKETSIHEVPFPAVTICPETKISGSCLNYTETLMKRRNGKGSEIDPIENVYFDYMSLLCRPENHVVSLDAFQKMNSSTRKSILRSNDYTEFLNDCKSVTLEYTYCKWMGTEVECKDILTPILTDEGLCYSFNMFDVRDIYSDINIMEYYAESRRNPDWDPDKGYPEGKLNDVYPRRAFMNGAKNALEVVVLTNKSDVYYSCRDFALQGIRVTLSMPARIPRPSQVFFSVGFERLTTVAVTPSYMTTTPKIREYDPKDRNCYFGRERKLKYFKLYSQSNCNMECWTNYTIDYCGCTHFYMPRDANTSICTLDKRFCLEDARVNYPISILSEHLNSKKKTGLTSDCNCLPICTDLNYNSEISSGYWKYSPEEEDMFSKDYHASAVKVFFKNSYFLPTEKSELYGFTDFVSNVGGILGLFTGFSLFSLAEIIYFLSVRLIENYRRYGYWAGERVAE